MAWDDRLWPGDRNMLRLIARADTSDDPSAPLAVSSLLAMGQGGVNRVCDLGLAGWCELLDHANERDALGFPTRVIRLTDEGRAALAAFPARAGAGTD